MEKVAHQSSGSRSNILPGTIMFSLFGFVGQSLYNRIDANHMAPITQQRSLGLWQSFLQSRFNPMRVLSDDDYEHMLNEKLLRVEAEIALLDEEMAKLNKHSQPSSLRPVE